MRTIHAYKMGGDLVHGSRRLALALEGNGRQSFDEDKIYFLDLLWHTRGNVATLATWPIMQDGGRDARRANLLVGPLASTFVRAEGELHVRSVFRCG